jgi:hypothetical protein
MRRAGFHEARHLLLDAQTNIAVDSICPCVVAVKTNGRQRNENTNRLKPAPAMGKGALQKRMHRAEHPAKR